MTRGDCILYVTALEAAYLLTLLHKHAIPALLADEQPVLDLQQRGFLEKDGARRWGLTHSGWAVAVALDALERDRNLVPKGSVGAHELMAPSETRH
jgi:hypothetical protein